MSESVKNKILVANKIVQLLDNRVDDTARSILHKYTAGLENDQTPNITMSELGLDSLGVAELLMDIEAEFKITIDQSDADSVTTLDQFVNLVVKVQSK